MIFWNLHEYYNYLQITQIYKKVIKSPNIVWLGLELKLKLMRNVMQLKHRHLSIIDCLMPALFASEGL